MKNVRLAVAIALTVIVATPVSAEVVEAKGDRFVTRDSVVVKTAPRETWLALTSPAKWWSSSHTWSGDAANLSLTPQGGGCFCERLPEKESVREIGLAGSAQHMVVIQAQPMAVLRMRGGLGPLQSEPAEGVLTIAMQATPDGGTKMVWEYVVGGSMRYEIGTIAKAVDGVLSEQMNRLADTLGRAEPGPAKAAKPAPAKTDTPLDPKDEAEAASVEDALDAMAEDKAPSEKKAVEPR